ncbi:MAG: hypothetical protein KF724_06945 [Phycisphaeraceae bacterium]|nr:hypothetical protein [Phycisphaeraceae bacterium]
MKSTVTMLAATALLGSVAMAGVNPPEFLAVWTFESLQSPFTAGPHPAEGGVIGGDATGEHASSATVWSSPVGNGSLRSFSSNNWTAGDTYTFTTSSLGYGDLEFGWSQTRSNTGPADFVVEWSAGGNGDEEVWFALLEYDIPVITWSSINFNAGSVFGPIKLPAEANDLEVLRIRLRSLVTTAAAGTNRIDDIIVVGTSTSGPPVCVENPDQSGDGCVNGADIAVVLGNWNPVEAGEPGAPGDVNCDGLVNGADIAVILGSWLTGSNCP